jgi:hypothetical protein
VPIHIPVYVNDRLIKTYHIGRLEGTTNPDSVNTYIVCQDDEMWAEGYRFTHRYGDGIDVCVLKGLTTLQEEK